ncbi:PadR family transcriptional regulator [Escherichia coli]|uniref:PadR family transcriptional regulator n=1 Tax=Escherichia coli TaxID=562 RepID=UPI000A86821E
MVDRNAAFRQHFLKVAIADRIATIPAHRPQDHITLEKKGYLTSRHERTGRRERRVYDITEQGRTALADAKTKVKELFGELVEGG